MSLSIGIVGLPNVGKSTLFEALTKNEVDRANYPFATIDPNVGVVPVPDKRVDMLAELSESDRKIYATVEFNDIAGLIKGAHKGEGLGNAFLSHIREVDAIVYVLRAFTSGDIINTEESVHPLRDKETLDTELALKDLETIERRLETVEKKAKSSSDKALKKEHAVLQRAFDVLKEGGILYGSDLTEEEREALGAYQLLTLKPRLYLLNGQPEDIAPDILTRFEAEGLPYAIVNVIDEHGGKELTGEEKEELGLTGLSDLINKAYSLLGLITFLTTGPQESRAWQVRRGATIREAAGVIHTDFEKKFIRADVISYDRLVELGGLKKAREKGAVRTEGKEYIVQDGDVVEIKHGA